MFIKSDIFIIFVLFFLYASGAMQNVFGFHYRSTFFDFILFIAYVAVLFKLPSVSKVHKNIFYIFSLYLFLFLFSIMIMLIGENDLLERVLGFRNLFYYIGSFFAAYVLLYERGEVERVQGLFGVLLFVFCLYGVVQSTLGHVLPDIMLKLEVNKFLSFHDSPDIVRANGLVGNSLEFSGLALISFSYWFSKLINKACSAYYILAVSVSVMAVYFSYSRTAIVVMFVCSFLLYLLKTLRNRSYLSFFINICLCVPVLLICMILTLTFSDNFLLKRFVNKDVNTLQSNEEHRSDFSNAVEVILENPFVGVGLGSQGVSSRSNPEDKIITDGFWFIMCLELGLIFSSVYLVFISYVLYFFYKTIRTSGPDLFANVSSVIVIFVAMHIMGITNSAYIAPVNLISVWIFAGTVAVVINKKDINNFRSYSSSQPVDAVI